MSRPRRVAVFCGSRPGRDAAYEEAARALGTAIGGRGWELVYGGGLVGLMGVVATATIEAGGRVHGIITEHLVVREVAMPGLTRLDVVATMFERKRLLIDDSDGFVVLPGGFGTIDELLDALTLKQLAEHAKPIVLLDPTGEFWTPWQALARHVVEQGFAAADTLELTTIVGDAAAALDLVEQAPG